MVLVKRLFGSINCEIIATRKNILGSNTEILQRERRVTCIQSLCI